jgi:hypothetical protein
MSGHQGLRCQSREWLDARIRVTWTDQHGATRYALCRCVDIAQAGVRVESQQPIPPRTTVNFQIESPVFGGSSTVRWCSRNRVLYHLGLAFSGVKWANATTGSPQPSGILAHTEL